MSPNNILVRRASRAPRDGGLWVIEARYNATPFDDEPLLSREDEGAEESRPPMCMRRLDRWSASRICLFSADLATRHEDIGPAIRHLQAAHGPLPVQNNVPRHLDLSEFVRYVPAGAPILAR